MLLIQDQWSNRQHDARPVSEVTGGALQSQSVPTPQRKAYDASSHWQEVLDPWLTPKSQQDIWELDLH